ncbi:hypothetical protein BKA01_001548 [Pseudonocardia eucalypti]|nr:hypothetical protein [Pseudonocardia eucalypti]
MRTDICALGHFFTTTQAATNWQAHHPGLTLVPIRQDFDTTRQAAIELGWTANQPAPRHADATDHRDQNLPSS